ncbi:MAG TPA: diguanylate cyclase [Spongiibacteraceae bacterium]|nr:diguanylate cyclase [Spongiibacteraceae bacterium]
MNRDAGDGRDWRAEYRRALREQEQQQALMALLARAAQRSANAATGLDRDLDARLGGLQQRLRDSTTTLAQLQGAIEALETQLKLSADTRSLSQRRFVDSIRDLANGLAARATDDVTRDALKQLGRNARQYGAHVSDWPTPLAALATHLDQIGSQPAPGLLQRWFGRGAPPADSGAATEHAEIADAGPSDSSAAVAQEAEQLETKSPETRGPKPEDLETAHPATGPVTSLPAGDTTAAQVIDAAAQYQRPLAMPAGALVESELAETTAATAPDIEPDPPFSRLSQAICSVLSELLRQIAPGDSGRADHAAALAQIARGLNWYELVPTLEHISLAVLSAIHRDQEEFQHYLGQLDARLAEAQQGLRLAQAFSDASQRADRELQANVRADLDGLQQEVADATELDLLKRQISQRLDGIVQAMDRFHATGSEQQGALTTQLDTLRERVEQMEQASRDAQDKLEQQHQLALRDMLTQLPNRQAYQQRLEQETERWRRYGRPLSLAVCDIDHFKTINDSYGHQAGDKVLRIIARTLRQRLRQTDFVARYGGEEFVVLLPETSAEDALAVMDAVRTAVAQCPFHFREQRVRITLSAGIAGFTAQSTAEQVFKRADQALYEAKRAGRNLCRSAA